MSYQQEIVGAIFWHTLYNGRLPEGPNPFTGGDCCQRVFAKRAVKPQLTNQQ